MESTFPAGQLNALKEHYHGVVQPKTFPMLRICVAMSAPLSVSSYLLHPGERRHELVLVMHYCEVVGSFIAKKYHRGAILVERWPQ